MFIGGRICGVAILTSFLYEVLFLHCHYHASKRLITPFPDSFVSSGVNLFDYFIKLARASCLVVILCNDAVWLLVWTNSSIIRNRCSLIQST